jgi:hypothetical protein
MRCSTINRDFIMRRVYFRTLRFAQNVFLNFDPRVDDTKVVLWQIDFFPAQSQGRFVIKRIVVVRVLIGVVKIISVQFGPRRRSMCHLEFQMCVCYTPVV